MCRSEIVDRFRRITGGGPANSTEELQRGGAEARVLERRDTSEGPVFAIDVDPRLLAETAVQGRE